VGSNPTTSTGFVKAAVRLPENGIIANLQAYGGNLDLTVLRHHG